MGATPEKQVLVTGAGARLGAVIAEHLGAQGWHVLVHYRFSETGARETLAHIENAGGHGELVQADLADMAQVKSLMADVCGRFGPVHALVNNASIFEPDEIGTLTEEQWDAHFDIHAKSPIWLARGLAAQLPAGERGAIVNLLDQRVLRPNPHFFSYTLSKSVLHTATRTMAQALSPHVRVNAVAPGPSMQNARQSESDFSAQKAATLLRAGSPPAEIARAVGYLLQATSVTGQTLAVDGGQSLIWDTSDIQGVVE